jgi:hypothetical protein
MIHFNMSSVTFASVDELIASARNTGEAAEILGSVTAWWDETTVRFDDTSKSASFVEVEGKSVTVGPPAHYHTYRLPTIFKALRFAEQVNTKWTTWGRDFNDYDKIISYCDQLMEDQNKG